MQTLANIQYLRAIAALMVVFGHAAHDAEVWSGKSVVAFTPAHLLPSGAGVDLFFVISGFIMVYASRAMFGQPGSAGAFAIRRLIRIVPLYWIMATAYLGTLVLQSGLIGKALPLPAHVVAAYVFLPVDTFGDGFLRPFFTLGWTLNYEMFFYLCFALAIGQPRGRAVALLAAGLAGLVALGLLAAPGPGVFQFWSQPIILEFVLGMGIALAYQHGWQCPGWLRAGLVALALAILWRDFLASATQPEGWITPNGLLRLLAWGVPAAMILAAAVLAPAPARTTSRARRWGVLLGDASYALYLSHPFVIVLVRKALLASGLFPILGGWALVALAAGLSCLVAVAVHLWLERPLTAWLTARLAPSPPAAALSPKPA